MQPDVRYARSGGVAIAYQVVGDGDTDLIYVPGYLSNLLYGWDSPHWRGFYDRLAKSFRLILFDKRGTGLSDYGGQFPALETRMDDVRAVLDAVGSSSTVLLGSQDGCSIFRRAKSRDTRPRSPHSATAGGPRSTATRCSRGMLRHSSRVWRSASGSPTGFASVRAPPSLTR